MEQERLLTLAVKFSQKTNNSQKLKNAYELLGDFEYKNIHPLEENNIAIPLLNEITYLKIINYYKLAGKKEKQTKAIKKLEVNKKNLKYIKITSKVTTTNYQEVSKLLEDHINYLLNLPRKFFPLILCYGDELLFMPYSKIKEITEKQLSKTEYHNFFDSKFTDMNNNTVSISHRKMMEHQLFHIGLQNRTFPFIYNLMDRALQNTK